MNYPIWLDSIYLEKEQLEGFENNNSIVEYEQLSDSYSKAVVLSNNGVCSFYTLSVYYLKNEIQSIPLSIMCDHEQSYGNSEYSKYVQVDSLYYVTTYFQYVDDSLMDGKGKLIVGTIDEYEQNLDSFMQVFYVKNTGEITTLVDTEL